MKGKYRKRNKTPIIILSILLVLAASLLGGMVWFMNTHFFVDGRAYALDATNLDLRGQNISVEAYERISQRLSACTIRWNVPFQSGYYPDTTTSLTVKTLTDGDLERLSYFPGLEQVDAVGCRDYAQLQKLGEIYPNVRLRYTVSIDGKDYFQDADSVTCTGLTEEDITLMGYLPELKQVDATGCPDPSRIRALTEALPGVEVSYQVELLGQTFTESDTAAVFQDPDVNVLREQLGSLPAMQTVALGATSAKAEDLRQLMAEYPHIAFTWEKTVLGKTFQNTDTEFDFSGIPLDSTDQVEKAMAYFPHAEKVILSDCGMDNETLAAFREKMRPEYKVVWTVYITKKPVRTDQEVIHSSALRVCFIDEQSQDLKYCEDAIVVDIGHSYVKNLEWVKGMPNLKYLILAHNWVRDISPLSSCKNLVYLELFWNKYVEDYSPLLGCTALEDLNISGTYADIEPIYEMTWLKNLWANQCDLTEAEQQTLRERLPNTTISTISYGDYTVGGWRQTKGYYDMRDIMGLPYNTW